MPSATPSGWGYLFYIAPRVMRLNGSFGLGLILAQVFLATVFFGGISLLTGYILARQYNGFGTSFFDQSSGLDPIWIQHMLWFFAHPEVMLVLTFVPMTLVTCVLWLLWFRKLAGWRGLSQSWGLSILRLIGLSILIYLPLTIAYGFTGAWIFLQPAGYDPGSHILRTLIGVVLLLLADGFTIYLLLRLAPVITGFIGATTSMQSAWRQTKGQTKSILQICLAWFLIDYVLDIGVGLMAELAGGIGREVVTIVVGTFVSALMWLWLITTVYCYGVGLTKTRLSNSATPA